VRPEGGINIIGGEHLARVVETNYDVNPNFKFILETRERLDRYHVLNLRDVT